MVRPARQAGAGGRSATDVIDAGNLTFVDADGLVTVLDRATPEHHFIAEVWRFEIDARSTLVTTDYSVLKAALALQESHGLAAVDRLFRDVVPALRVERCTRADVDQAVVSLMASGDAGRDLVRHIEDRVRARLRVTRALSRG